MAVTYTCEVTVERPLDEVVAIFADPDKIAHWQPGFLGIEHLEGESGAAGSRSRMRYRWGKGEMELIETIEVNDLPTRFSALYETPKVWNRVDNRFEATDSGGTRWISDCEFRFQGVLMKTMGFVMPGAFRKQTAKMMGHFKEYAEDGTSVAETAS